MQNIGYYCFWGMLYSMLFWETALWFGWVMSFMAGDPVYQEDCFQRFQVASSWFATLVLIGIASGFYQKAKSPSN